MIVSEKTYQAMCDKHGEAFKAATEGHCRIANGVAELDRGAYLNAVREAAQTPPTPRINTKTRGSIIALTGLRGNMNNFERFVETCRESGYNVVEVKSKGDWRDIKLAVGQTKDCKFVVRKEENGCLFVNEQWRRSVNRLYDLGILPIGVDFGYFDHYRTYSLDRYLPGTAMPAGTVEIPETYKRRLEIPRFAQRYIEKKLDQLNKAGDPPDGIKGAFVCIWLQFSAALLRDPFKLPSMAKWAAMCASEVRRQGLIPVIKTSPVLQGVEELSGVLQYSDRDTACRGVTVDKSGLLNARLIRHAEHHIICTTSASNEIVIGDGAIVATGKSWFTGTKVFHEPDTWGEVAKTPKVNTNARIQWANWWGKRSLPHGKDPSPIFDDIVARFQAGPGMNRLATTLASELKQWGERGLPVCPEKEYKSRMEICRPCKHWMPKGWIGLGRCRLCGCSRAKLSLATSKCPIHKW